MPANPACTRCPLHATTTSRCIWGNGPERADIMFIGEAPGADEEKQGQPFVGPAGKLMDGLLQQAGLNRSEVRFTNLVRCRPPSNRTPTAHEQATCFPYLAEEIAQVQPKVIVILGAATLNFLTGKKSINAERGKLLEPKSTIRLGSTKLFATIHPAAYLHGRDPNIPKQIVDDILIAKRTLETEKQDEQQHVLLYGDYSLEALISAMKRLKDASVLACDLEWSGGQQMMWPWTSGSYMLSVAFSGRVNGQVASVAVGWPLPERGDKVLQALFAAKPVAFHNAMADLIWLTGLGYTTRLAGDSMLLAHLLDEEQPLSLNQVAIRYANAKPGWKDKPEFIRPQTPGQWERLLSYNCEDAAMTLTTLEALHRELRSRPEEERANILRLYQELVLPSVKTFVTMALTGMPLDMELLEQTIAESKVEQDRHADRLGQMIGLHRDHARSIATSPQQSTRLLNEHFHLDIDGSSKSALEEHDDHPVVQEIQAIRHESKFQGTYLEPWQRMALSQGDARLHSVYRQVTRTGRTSAETEDGGSVQVAPREARVRRLFRAPSGKKIVAGDYSQAELRVAAWFANERTMLRVYNESRTSDIHKATGAYIRAYQQDKLTVAQYWPIREQYIAKLTKEERQQAKPANFGFIYGLGADKFVHYARQNYKVLLTPPQSETIRAGYFELYSDLPEWHRRCEWEAVTKGYVTTAFGRYRRHLEDARKAINTPVQGTATELTMLAMNEVAKRLEGKKWAELIGFVHDSIETLADDEAAEEVKYIIQTAMENPQWSRFGIKEPPLPFYADVHISERWIEE